MGAEIIADKFALLKSKGSNGVAFTHLVEDTLLGERAVVKVSDKLGLLTLEYLKTVNLAREMEIAGLLLPFEGGIMEEGGYYLAYPELGEPSLENYLRMGVPVTCAEALEIVAQVLDTLEEMHAAGFYHLFVDARNVFYRTRGRVTLKDPALRAELFYPLLELVAAPDFSYLRPELMDGAEPGAKADLYAVGRLAERLLEEASDAQASPLARVLEWAALECRHGEAGGRQVAGYIREELLKTPEDAVSPVSLSSHARKRSVAAASTAVVEGRLGLERLAGQPAGPEVGAGFPGRRGRRSHAALLLVITVTVALLAGVAALLGTLGGAGSGVVKGSAVGSPAGVEESVGGMEPGDASADGGISVDSLAAGEDTEASQEEAVATPDSGHGAPQAQPAVVSPLPSSGPPAQATGERSPLHPRASFTLSPSQGQSPLQVYLDASSSYDPDGSIVSYSWSFGGGGRALFHVFESNVIPSTVAVTLTVTDDGGHTASATRYLTLY